jgi:hypothetical protein
MINYRPLLFASCVAAIALPAHAELPQHIQELFI